MVTSKKPDAPLNSTHPETLLAWRKWLEKNHGREDGIWLVMWKKESGRARLEYDGLVEEALCFGWVDSKPAKLDAERSMLWFAPRKAKTGWSRLNKTRVQKIIADGRITAAGLAKVEAAKADGTWFVLDDVEALKLPSDLVAAFSKHKQAATFFDAFPRSVKRNILEWIGNAKTYATREKRIVETATRAAVNERANQWRTLRKE
jgi:uncharacterized protein YdeI (YjbR/CyaY-like superfamily)